MILTVTYYIPVPSSTDTNINKIICKIKLL